MAPSARVDQRIDWSDSVTSDSKPELVIICGAARSGTTLLHGVVGGHPKIHGAATEWFGWGYHRPKIARAAGIPAPDTPERMRRMLTVGLTKTPMKGTGADLDVALSLVESYPSDWEHLMLIVVEAMRRTSGLNMVAVKTPSIEAELLYLHDFFSANGWNVRWIYSVRHPYDAYLSFRKISAVWRRDLLHSDALRWAGRWIDSGAEALEAVAALGKDVVRIHRFEDLLADPAGTCRGLCDWMGLEDASDEMLLAQGRTPNTSFRDRKVPTKAGAVQDLRRRPRVGLSKPEEDALRIACGSRARAFGYDLGPLKGKADLPQHLPQTLRMAQLSASNYVSFLPRELARRSARAAKAAYSLVSGRATTSTNF